KVYLLDKSKLKMQIVQEVEQQLGLKMFQVLPKKRIGEEEINNINVQDFAYPNPAQWLRGFEDAEFVITDSFHGTAFAIKYNIPFIAIGNPERGMARFESLLRMFDLKERLILEDIDNAKIHSFIEKDIDWKK